MSNLVPVPWQPGYKLTPDTLALLLAASARLGSNIYLVDAWRSYEYQKRLRVGYETVGPPQYNYASDPDDPNAQNNHMRGAAFDTFKTDAATQAACRAVGLVRDASESWHWNNPNWRNMPIIPTDDGTSVAGNAIKLSAVIRPVRSTDMLFFEYNGTLPAGQRSVIAVDPATGTYRYPEPWEVGAIRNEVAAGRALINPLGEPEWSQTFSRLREVKIA